MTKSQFTLTTEPKNGDKKVKKLRVILSVISCAFGTAQASPILTLQDLFNGQDIVVGDKLFSDWQLLNDEMGADLSQIDVISLTDPLNQGLRYEANSQWAVSDAQTRYTSFEFTYDVTVLEPSFAITDASMAMTDFSFEGEGGAIEIQNAIFPPSLIVGVRANNRLGVFQLSDSQQFAPDFAPQTFLDDVETLIHFEDTLGTTVSLDAFEVRYSQVSLPEPSTFALFSLGLLGLGLARKRTT